MRPVRHQDDLTARERDVLGLIRLGLTNEEIAARLDISLAGAKYHVSQILSKLGVATREEAAVVDERRRWWAAWPVWARTAGAATVAAAAAGLAVLAWGVLRTGGEPNDDGLASLTVEELYSRVGQAINRPGFVIHSSIEIRRLEGVPGPPVVNFELWADASGERIRWGGAVVGLVVGDSFYVPGGPGEVNDVSTMLGRPCPGTDSLVVSGVLLCDAPQPNSSNMSLEANVEPNAEYEGESSVVFGLDASEMTMVPASLLNPPTSGTVPPNESLVPLENRSTSRTHIAAETFLPLVRLYEFRQNGDITYKSAWTYKHEFIPIGDLSADFFDPASLEDITQFPPVP